MSGGRGSAARAGIRRLVPEWLADAIVTLKGPLAHQIASARRSAELAWGGPLPTEGEGRGSDDWRVGILKDRAGYYTFNLLACRELGVAFRVLDLESSKWIEEIRSTPCSAYLPWPSTNLTIWKELWDERLPLLQSVTGRPVCPTPEEIWLLDSKRRVRDWLLAKGVPGARTEVFYSAEEAMAFAGACALPIVLKTNAGASSHGVWVFRERRGLEKAVARAFGRGLRTKRGDWRDRSWGHVILQEYVEHDSEWRVARIGDSYLCRRKTRIGDFASGGGAVEWATPDPKLLDFARDVTNRGAFTSMVLDVFAKSGGGGFLVNEMQCLVGAAPGNAHPLRGRWRRKNDAWQFEPGDFYRNACANLRVQFLRETGP